MSQRRRECDVLGVPIDLVRLANYLLIVVELLEDEFGNLSIGELATQENARLGSEQYAALRWGFRRCAVRSVNQVRVERDCFRSRVDEELDRVVARLAVDIHGAGILRRFGIIQPEVISLPTVRIRDDYQVTGTRIVDLACRQSIAAKHFRDAGHFAEQASYFFDDFWVGILYVDMRKLVIG